jgi:glycerophosphoryl diester phosphodiesterase
MPENSIEGFLYTLSYPITTLKLDVVLTKNLVVLVSHEPWFFPEICSFQSIDSNNIFQMTYSEVQQVVCGNQAHPRFPEQKTIPSINPL